MLKLETMNAVKLRDKNLIMKVHCVWIKSGPLEHPS